MILSYTNYKIQFIIIPIIILSTYTKISITCRYSILSNTHIKNINNINNEVRKETEMKEEGGRRKKEEDICQNCR